MSTKALRTSFVAIESAILIVFAIADFCGKDSTAIKYVGVLLCFLFCVLQTKESADFVVLAIAFAFTAIADYFLLVKNESYVFGLCSFIVAQSVYFARLVMRGVDAKKSLVFRIVAMALSIGALVLFSLAEFLTILVAIYFVSLVANCIESSFFAKKDFESKLFFVGLLLFVCCDISVGIHNFSSYIDVSGFEPLVRVFSYAIWLFYLPSQVLIALSGQRRNNAE